LFPYTTLFRSIRAIATTWPTSVALAHVSAALVLGLPLLGQHGTHVHGIRPGLSFRQIRYFTLRGGCAAARTIVHDGLRVLEPAYVILGIASLVGLVVPVAAGGQALHGGQVTCPGMREVAEECRNHAGADVFRAGIWLMEDGCESPGEPRPRLPLPRLGLDARSQEVVRDASG